MTVYIASLATVRYACFSPPRYRRAKRCARACVRALTLNPHRIRAFSSSFDAMRLTNMTREREREKASRRRRWTTPESVATDLWNSRVKRATQSSPPSQDRHSDSFAPSFPLQRSRDSTMERDTSRSFELPVSDVATSICNGDRLARVARNRETTRSERHVRVALLGARCPAIESTGRSATGTRVDRDFDARRGVDASRVRSWNPSPRNATGSSSRRTSSRLLREVLKGESRAYVDTLILLLP